MEHRKRLALSSNDRTMSPGFAVPDPDPNAKPHMNRHQRRRQAAFNKKLAARLRKDDTPVTVETLPDGGLHVHVDVRDPEKKEQR